MTLEDIQLLLNMPPEEIIIWFRQKGLRTNWDWYETWQDAHAQTFTVAKVMKMDILQDIKEAMVERFENGETFEQFKRKLEPILKEKGWWGKVKAKDVPGVDTDSLDEPDKIVQLGSPHRLATIYRVNTNVAFNSAHYKFQIENAVNRPYWQYLQIQRESKRKTHAKLHKLVFMYNDPIWDIIYPPNDWNCGCRVKALDKKELDRLGLSVSNGSDYLEFVNSIIPEEWRYNPGKTAFQVDLSKYDSDIAKQY